MFSAVFGLKGMAIGIAIASLVAFGGGFKAASVYYNVKIVSANLKAEQLKVAALEDNLRLIREALDADSKTQATDLAAIEEMKRKANEVVEQSTDTVVFDAAGTERLRGYFNSGPR